jgi:CO/xanthine dehydrogenase Mo-binding subunit
MLVAGDHVVARNRNFGGIGEAALSPAALALRNAIFATTGNPLRSLPISPRLRALPVNG